MVKEDRGQRSKVTFSDNIPATFVSHVLCLSRDIPPSLESLFRASYEFGVFFFYRWLLPGGNRRDFCGPLPGGPKAGMGSFLHGVALLGYDVSPVCLLLVYSDGMILGGLINN